ncbi:hypothetical protein Tco_1443147, partial [Tanacetum coccineum]
MTTTTAQQVALDNALVPLKKRVEIGRCNMRMDHAKTQKEPTYQVVLDALTLTTCYPAFLITADVPEIYMQQFWFTVNKKDSTTYRFKIDKKRYKIDMEVFKEIFWICPRLPNQDFDELSSDEEIVSFIKELGHKEDVKSITKVVVDHMYQPWRTFAAIINKCLSGKITSLDKIRLSRTHIDNRDHKKQEKMYYLRFTKAIIHHFITKDKMTNQQMQDFDAYKTYLTYATGAASPKMKRKFKKPASLSKKRTFVPGVSTTDSSDSENESWGNSGDEANEQSDDDHEQDDDELIEYDNLRTSDTEEETQDDE